MILGEGKESPRSSPNIVSGVSLEERRTVVLSMPAHQRRATWVHRRDCGWDPGVVRVVIARTGVQSAGRSPSPFYGCRGRSCIVVPTVGRWRSGHAPPLAGASPGKTGLAPANSHRTDGQGNQSQGGNPLRRPTSACCVRAALRLGNVSECCRPSINCIRCRSALPRDADAIVRRHYGIAR